MTTPTQCPNCGSTGKLDSHLADVKIQYECASVEYYSRGFRESSVCIKRQLSACQKREAALRQLVIKYQRSDYGDGYGVCICCMKGGDDKCSPSCELQRVLSLTGFEKEAE